jgi:hypothetical protein
MMLALSMKLPSVANMREHWTTKARRVKVQRSTVALAMLVEKRALLDLHARLARGEDLRCVLTRLSPRKLDSDNLESAFKAIRDEVARQLGVDDGGDRVEWVCKQLPGPTAVIVAIAARECAA